jgi:protein arginine kinase activator
MCADCPHLERHLYGMHAKKGTSLDLSQETALTCASCSTSLEQVRKGQLVGCTSCYEVFADVILADLLKGHLISRHLTSNKKTQLLHIGRVPGEVSEISPTLRLIALNEALDETLIREDYEQAALLRDQIESLKRKGKVDE